MSSIKAIIDPKLNPWVPQNDHRLSRPRHQLSSAPYDAERVFALHCSAVERSGFSVSMLRKLAVWMQTECF